MPYPKFKKTEITQDEYREKWSLSLLPIATMTDPSGTMHSSTHGVPRMVTVWGTDCDTPVLEAKTSGEETTYFKYGLKTI